MVNSQAWGPILWRILHTFAEKLGRHKIPLLATDEKRAFVNLLKSVEMVMPCMKCRQHYRAWRQKRPIERFMGSYDIREDAREWLWALHEEVNTSKAITGPLLSEIPGLYGTRKIQELNDDLQLLVENLHEAALYRHVETEAIHTFRKAFAMLRAIVG